MIILKSTRFLVSNLQVSNLINEVRIMLPILY